MNDRAVVTVSMLIVGVMVVLSRQWLGDAKAYVRTATGHSADAAPSSSFVASSDPATVAASSRSRLQ